jgi:thiol:disulfide interchange protein DsbD
MMKRWWMVWLIPLWLSAGFLTAEEAFKPSVTLENGCFHVQIDVAEHIHLSKESLRFAAEPKEKVELLPYTLPVPQKDEFGDEVYTGRFEVGVPFKVLDPQTEKVTFLLSYQGCSDNGVCYPPVTKRYTFALPALKRDTAPPMKPTWQASASKSAKPTATTASSQKAQHQSLSEEASVASMLANKSFGAVLLTFFGFGLLMALTPCVFPMIPILSSIIVAQGKGMTAGRGFFLSLVYVLAMALTYTVAGVLAGLFGANIQAAMQNPWVIGAFAGLFVALAFSMFGFYELQLPASWQSKLSRTSDEAGKKGGVAGVAVMGFLSALIVGPCVAPPLAGALMYIGQTGDALLGGLALFVMSLGMGAPLLLVGTGAGRFMPKPGGWMSAVSRVFGVVMLAVAVWMLSRILPDGVTMGLWALLAIVSAVYMGALEPLAKGSGWPALFKGLGVALLLYGAMLLVGAFSGATNPLSPLEGLRGNGTSAVLSNRPLFTRVSASALMDRIKTANRPVIVDFRADWCVSCKELEETTFKDPAVRRALQNYTLYQVDVTDNTPAQKALMRELGIYGPPAILFFEKGKELRAKRTTGYKSPRAFVALLQS